MHTDETTGEEVLDEGDEGYVAPEVEEEVEKKTEPEISMDQLVSKLKDPAMLAAIATTMGLEVKRPEKPVEKPEDKEPELPVIEIDPDASKEDLIAALNKMGAALKGYIDQKTTKVEQKAEGVVKQTEEARVGTMVNEFKAKNADWNELLPVLDPLWRSGKYTLDEAAKLARKAMGKPEPTSKKSGEGDGKNKPRSIKLDATPTGDKNTLRKPIQTIRDAAKINLDKIMKDRGLSSSDFEE